MSLKIQTTKSEAQIFSINSYDPVALRTQIKTHEPVFNLSWKNLSYSYTKDKKKVEVLKNVSGFANSGEILAILGASGCGKSTFLSILADKLRPQENSSTSGSLYLNYIEIKELQYSSYVGFLPQQNIFFDYFTVRESLKFVGQLRLGIQGQQLNKKVSKVLKLLKIQHLSERNIGNSFKRGLSGGEVKRVCIAMEVLCDFSILILDEPTSGLDSSNALIVIKVLKKMTQKGKMVILSVHQPGNKLYSLFDRMILLTCGHFVFQGRREDCLQHFNSLGFDCPSFLNPAEFFIKTIHVHNVFKLTEEESLKLEMFIKNCPEEEKLNQLLINLDLKDFSHNKKLSLQIKELVKRSSLGLLRSPIGLMFQGIKAVVLVIIVICLYYDLGKDTKGINDRTGLLMNGIYNVLYFPMLIESFTLPIERALVHKEINEGMYSIEAYFFSKCLVDLCVYITLSVIMNCIVYYPVGLNDSSPAKLFVALGILILSQINGVFQGYIAGGLSNNVQMASFIGPVLSTPPVLFSGFFSDVRSIPDAFEWLKFTTPYYYSYQALLLNEFDGLDIDEHIRPTPRQRFNLHGEIKDYVFMFIANTIVSLMIAYALMKIRVRRSIAYRKGKIESNAFLDTK